MERARSVGFHERRRRWVHYDAFGGRTARAVSGITTPYLHDGLNPATVSKTGTDDTPFQFTGRENDGATNLYYYRARYYNPALGRFISSDPLGLGGGLNTYAYADGDPISRIDPLGLQAAWANNFAQTFNFGSYQAMAQTAAAYSAYTQNPAWQQEGPNPVSGCFDIGCENVNNYVLGWVEAGAWTLAGEVAPAVAGGMCRVATPNSVKGLLTAMRLLDMHGAQMC